MWKPLLRCSIVGGVIVFLWMCLSWTVFPFHKMSMLRFSDESEVISTVLSSAPEDGIYMAPYMNAKNQEMRNQNRGGAFLFTNVRRGVDFTDVTRPMIIGLITQIVGAFLITYFLLKAKIRKYWGRVFFVTLIGITIPILGLVPAWNWWHFPNCWLILNFIDYFIAWFLGGLVIGKLVKD